MSEEEISNKCRRFGGKHKKVLVVLGVFVLLVIFAVSVGCKLHGNKNLANYEYAHGDDFSEMKRGGKSCAVSSLPIEENQFPIPEDASRNGEIALVVSDLEIARRAVADAAAKNGGNVFATAISYASSESKNGSMVVQVPVENFDKAFAALKNVGSRLIQESTQQIAPRNIYPMMTPAANNGQEDVKNAAPADGAVSASTSSEMAVAQTMIYPPYQQTIQNKGYVKVVFVDYGKDKKFDNAIGGSSFSSNSKGLWLALGLKSILLIVLFVILLIMLRRIFQNLRAIRAIKKVKRTVHVVRQMPKVNKRVVKVQRRR